MRCTYCNNKEFYQGPSGGMSTNVLCANPDCRHWFNHTPMGLVDLNKVEPTKAEEDHEKAKRAADWERSRKARFEEGAEAFHNGRDPQTLRTSPSYGGYAEASDNIDRLVGYLRAMERKL